MKDNLPELVAEALPGGGRLWQSNDAAEGQPGILFVHGAYHGAWCYEAWLKGFIQRGIAVAAVDLPGHGGLRQPEGYTELSISDYASCVEEAARSLDRPLLAIGHSLGALILAKAAESLLFDALCLLAPSPVGNLPEAAKVPLVPDSRPVPVPSLSVYRDVYLAGQGTVEKWHSQLVVESSRALNDRYDLRVHVRPSVRRGLVIEAGQEDAVRHPPGQDRALANFFGYRHILLPSASHCMMLQEPNQTAYEIVEEWALDELESLSDTVLR